MMITTTTTTTTTGCCQKLLGFTCLVVAIIVGVARHLSQKPSGVHINLNVPSAPGQSSPSSPPLLLGNNALTTVLTREQLELYHRDGFVLVRQLLTKDEAIELKDAVEDTSSKNFDVLSLFGFNSYQKVFFDLWRTSPEIASLSLQALPSVAAQLLMPFYSKGSTTTTGSGSDENSDGSLPSSSLLSSVKPFRLLRDAYFSFAPPGEGCGWHVDDEGFFPADQESVGPTFWIALDPIKTVEGGGIAVLNRTIFGQQVESKYLSEDDCREAIKGATCRMEEKSPECQVKMDASKMEFDMDPGDALIWDRYTFHRGIPATDKYPKTTTNDDGSDDVKQAPVSKKRYSVRYIPFGATAKGAVHSSVRQGEVFESPYYPQVWPKVLADEMKALENGLDQDLTLSSAIRTLARIFTKKYLPFLLPSAIE
mmetsp:Transcript_30216/g.73484  ORF Transcript_30216/g.73484 Transcript_30216/m.73484 type:complete len:424 (+) Transcript_30216:169-1440(+)